MGPGNPHPRPDGRRGGQECILTAIMPQLGRRLGCPSDQSKAPGATAGDKQAPRKRLGSTDWGNADQVHHETPLPLVRPWRAALTLRNQQVLARMWEAGVLMHPGGRMESGAAVGENSLSLPKSKQNHHVAQHIPGRDPPTELEAGTQRDGHPCKFTAMLSQQSKCGAARVSVADDGPTNCGPCPRGIYSARPREEIPTCSSAGHQRACQVQ